MGEKKEYIERGAFLNWLNKRMDEVGTDEESRFYVNQTMTILESYPAADVEPVVRCCKCKYGCPIKPHADGVYGLNCSIGRGEEVRNVWHKYSKHYEDYSIVDANGFCDQGEAGEPSVERSGKI